MGGALGELREKFPTALDVTAFAFEGQHATGVDYENHH